MPVRIANITFDCHDALVVGGFWSAVLERPLDPISSSGFASIGGTDPERSQPAWHFERVTERKRFKNRVHLDLTVADGDAVARLVALGATLVAEHELGNGGHRWTVMQDPEGNEFCIAADSFVS